MEDWYSGIGLVYFGMVVRAVRGVVARRRVVVGLGVQVLLLRVVFGADWFCFVPYVFCVQWVGGEGEGVG